MSLAALHAWIDRQFTVPLDRWWLRIAASASSLAAAFAVEQGVGGVSTWFLVVVGLIALASVLGPDSQMSSLVILIVIWRWLATVDDPLSWPLVMVAVGLHVYHATLALLAAAPDTVSIPGSVIVRWAARSGFATGAAVATWLLVLVLDGRSFGGSSVLTAAALVIVAAAGIVLIGAVLERDPDESTAGPSGGSGGTRVS